MNLHFTKSSVIKTRDAADRDSWPHRITEDWLALMAEVKRLEAQIELEKKNIQYRDDIIGMSPDGDRHAH